MPIPKIGFFLCQEKIFIDQIGAAQFFISLKGIYFFQKKICLIHFLIDVGKAGFRHVVPMCENPAREPRHDS